MPNFMKIFDTLILGHWTNQPTNQPTNSMEQSPSWEAYLVNKSPALHETRRFITAFTRASHLYQILNQISPLHASPYHCLEDLASRYGRDDPRIESRLGRDLPHPSRPTRGSPSLLCNGYRLSFPGVKRPERGVNHPPLSSAEVKE
jgi:hypothetical protein